MQLNDSSNEQIIPGRYFLPYNTFFFELHAVKTFDDGRDPKESTAIQIIIMLEQDIPKLTTTVPNSIFGRKVNMNVDIEVQIDYPKSPDEAFYSLIIFYEYDIVATKEYAFTKFAFKVWDHFNDVKPENQEITFRISLYDPDFFMPSQSTFTIEINLAPLPGVIIATPSSGGTALETNF